MYNVRALFNIYIKYILYIYIYIHIHIYKIYTIYMYVCIMLMHYLNCIWDKDYKIMHTLLEKCILVRPRLVLEIGGRIAKKSVFKL